MSGFPTCEEREGLVRFLAPVYKDVPSEKMPVFYNRLMELRRDVSTAVLDAIARSSGKHLEVLDGLAATGVCGIRYAKESEADMEVTINDHNPMAYAIIEKNIKRNRLINAIATRRDVNSILSERFFDVIDIDPFGSPVPYLDAAFQSLKLGGALFVTATDTAALCGAYRKTCFRRYHAVSARTPYMHELGLRILIACCARTAAKYDLAIKPLLSYSLDHYFRIYLETDGGCNAADNCLGNIGYIAHDMETSGWKALPGNSIPVKVKGALAAGPVWLGPLHDRDFLDKLHVKDFFGTKKRLDKVLALWKEEADAPPFFYKVSEVTSLLRVSPPPLANVLEKLHESGYFAGRTHFDPGTFKTDAPAGVVLGVVRQLTGS